MSTPKNMTRHQATPFQRGLSALLATLIALPPAGAQVLEDGPTAVPVAEPSEEAAPAEGREAALAKRAPTGDDEEPPRRTTGLEVAGRSDLDLIAYAAPVTTGAKSAVTPQAIPLPTAGGSASGMGESFSPVLSSGGASFSIPLDVPAGRNGVQPSLGLAYSSSGGNDVLGLGWGLGVPFIARQSDRGLPRYHDSKAWTPAEDRFFFNGGQELLAVDSGKAELADCGSPGCAPVPAELVGWQQYRARTGSDFLRFFRAPDGRRWVVQNQSGGRLELGVLGDGPPEAKVASQAALESEHTGGSGRIYEWHLSRTSDAHGSAVYYLHDEHEGQRYLTDVYYTSPHGACGNLADASARMRCAAPLASYGHRVRLVYEPRPDVLTSYVSSWAIRTARRLRRIEMTAAEGAPGKRSLVRRYHLRYDKQSHWSLLASVQLEGRPEKLDMGAMVAVGDASVDETTLGDGIVGKTSAPIELEYTRQPSTGPQVAGFGGFDGRVHTSPASPADSVGAEADLFDVNSDGLADLVVTDPARFRTSDGQPAAGVYFNGFAGHEPGEAGGFSPPLALGLPPGLSLTMRLSNANLSPMDVDGDGRGDYLHLPRSRKTGYFTPVRSGEGVVPAEQGWSWAYVPRELPVNDPDPRIDFAHDAARLQVFDVNNDHLVDIVRTSGTSVQTWLNLGWLPGGDGRYGSYVHVNGAWQLSTQPVESCLPSAGLPLDFASPEVQLGDMNGDGLTDIVRMRAGSLVFWPGRGEGAFGVGPSECRGGIATSRHVVVASPPIELNGELDQVSLADVNGDGLDDVMQVRASEIDLWLNRNGTSFLPRVTVRGLPFSPAFDRKVRVTDIDGSGTLDVVFARAGKWQWVDLLGGERPRLLHRVRGSLGGESTITYGTSSEDYLRDLADAGACSGAGCDRFTWSGGAGCDGKIAAASGRCVRRSGGSPVITSVMRESVASDRLDRLGLPEGRIVTRYRYHDGYYEGIEQEFRGFAAADVELVGDSSQPTSIQRSHFHQGRRPQAIASDRLADNPDDALAGVVYLSETRDAQGVYLSTAHTSYARRPHLTSLSGRQVSVVQSRQTDTFLYDSGAYVASAPGTVESLPGVIRGGVTELHAVPRRASGYAHTRSTVDEVSPLGHVLRATAHGRLRGGLGEPVPDERIVTHASYTNLPGSASGWYWLQSGSFVDGHGDATRLGETSLTFDADGDVLRTTQPISQPATYAFPGDAQADGYVAAAPAALVQTATFDAWGSPLVTCSGGEASTMSGCLRLSTVSYDLDFATTALAQRLATGPGAGTGGFAWLVSGGAWDRGLGQPSSITDANGELTEMRFDGLGRMTAMRGPDVAGCSGRLPVTRTTYFDRATQADPPVTRVLTSTSLSCVDAGQRLDAYTYVDGMGRGRASVTTGGSGPGETWVRSGLAAHNASGMPRRGYQAGFFAGAPGDLAAVLRLPGSAQALPSSEIIRDAFARVVKTVAEDGTRVVTVHRALGQDVWDELDLASTGVAIGTPSSTRVDGHGRTVEQLTRNRQPGQSTIEHQRLVMRHRADGAVVRVDRARTSDDQPWSKTSVTRQVTRTLELDSLGRRVTSVDPDTRNPGNGAGWRYLFNRASDLVAVRDPRGCGQNFYYDLLGRSVGEAYVGCAEAPILEDAVATMAWGVGLEPVSSRPVDVLNVYDDLSAAWAAPASLADYPADAAPTASRLVASVDRGQRALFAYDRRGNLTWMARQMAVVPLRGPSSNALPPTPVPPSGAGDAVPAASRTPVFDEAHTYVKLVAYDHGNRGRSAVLPRDPDFAAPDQPGPRLLATIEHDRRGLPRRTAFSLVGGNAAVVRVDGAATIAGTTLLEQTVIADTRYTRDGLPAQVTLGDDKGGTRTPTVTSTVYDVRRRPLSLTTTRSPTGVALPGEQPLSAVTLLQAQHHVWDAASNLVAVEDHRAADEWPAGHKPQWKTISHDALYRAVGVEYEYAQDDGVLAGDTASNWRAEQERVRNVDPMFERPAPIVPVLPDERVLSQTWQYDWLGNMVDWRDDAHAVHERSLGGITNGADLSAGERPSALYLASDLSGPAGARGGWVEVDYGVSGNVTQVVAHGQCVDAPAQVCADPGGALTSRRAALRSTCACQVEEAYHYRWDELNRLSEARRYDRAGATGNYMVKTRLRFRYDASNQRAAKVVTDSNTGEVTALSVYPGDFERRGLLRTDTTYLAETAPRDTQSEYLVSGARVVWQSGDPKLGLDADHRVSFSLADLLESTTAVIDLRTGELTQVGSFYPNGGRETLLAAPTLVPIEPDGFTGKEDDSEVGLVYFGERYLISALARWATPDPLAIHAMGGGEALNSYHYVAGNLLQARNPIGLSGEQMSQRHDEAPDADEGIDAKDVAAAATGADGLANEAHDLNTEAARKKFDAQEKLKKQHHRPEPKRKNKNYRHPGKANKPTKRKFSSPARKLKLPGFLGPVTDLVTVSSSYKEVVEQSGTEDGVQLDKAVGLAMDTIGLAGNFIPIPAVKVVAVGVSAGYDIGSLFEKGCSALGHCSAKLRAIYAQDREDASNILSSVPGLRFMDALDVKITRKLSRWKAEQNAGKGGSE